MSKIKNWIGYSLLVFSNHLLHDERLRSVIQGDDFSPVMFVCCDSQKASELRKKWAVPYVRFVSPNLHEILRMAPRTIVISSDVDLSKDMQGEGSLRNILQSRQKTWGNRAKWIEL